MTQVLIADDHPLYRDALKAALTMSFSTLSLLEASDLSETVSALEAHDIDLLLLDLHMPGSQDLFGLLHIRKLFPDTPVAIVSGSDDPGIASKVISVGALGFIPKTASRQQIKEAVESILDGEVWIPESLSDQLQEVDNDFSFKFLTLNEV